MKVDLKNKEIDKLNQELKRKDKQLSDKTNSTQGLQAQFTEQINKLKADLKKQQDENKQRQTDIALLEREIHEKKEQTTLLEEAKRIEAAYLSEIEDLKLRFEAKDNDIKLRE